MNNDTDKVRLFVMDNALTKFIPQMSINQSFKNVDFKSFEPMENTVEAVRYLSTENTGIEVYVLLSSFDKKSRDENNEWFDKHFPSLDKLERIFLEYGRYNEAVPGGIGIADFLLDYHTENLDKWKKAGGQGIRLTNDFNCNHPWLGMEIAFDREETVFKYELVSKISSAVIDIQFQKLMHDVDNAISRIGGIATRRNWAVTKAGRNGEKCVMKEKVRKNLIDGKER